MQPNFLPARLTRFAILGVAGAAALSVGACHKNSPEASTLESVSGMIASVSGSTVQVTQPTGTVTVDVSSSAKVDEFSKARLTDIVVGSCVNVTPTPDSPSGDAFTALSVQRTQPVSDGKCWEPKRAASPGQPVNGTVASMADNTIDVTFTGADGERSEAHVTVTGNTHYSQDTLTNSEAIAQGKCITARGTKDGDAPLQATAVTLGPAANGRCS